MKDDSLTLEDYQQVRDGLSKDWMVSIDERLTLLVDTYLYYYGEPKDYRGFREMTANSVNGLLLWALANRFVDLPEEHASSDEEREAYAERRKKDANPAEPGRSRATPFGGYV